MEFKGTKGCWKLVENGYGYYTSVISLDDARRICVSRVNNIKESNANLRLIAHSPEMHELLKEILASEILKGTILESKTKRLLINATEI